MRREILIGFGLVLCGTLILAQEDGQKVSSGPQVGKTLPGPFDCLIVNGPRKGQQHCLVCEHGLSPAVIVFTREPGEGKEGMLNSLLAKLDEAVDRHRDESLGAAVVFLSPDAKNSANNSQEKDIDKLVAEAKARTDLLKRLAARTEKLKNVVAGCVAIEGPEGYKISPKAETTVLLCERHQVVANFAFAAGKMSDADVGRIIMKLDEVIKARAGK